MNFVELTQEELLTVAGGQDDVLILEGVREHVEKCLVFVELGLTPMTIVGCN